VHPVHDIGKGQALPDDDRLDFVANVHIHVWFLLLFE
jgi:hypothetical protein